MVEESEASNQSASPEMSAGEMMASHWPWLQSTPEHTFPQAPQFASSVLRFTQPDGHRVRPGLQPPVVVEPEVVLVEVLELVVVPVPVVELVVLPVLDDVVEPEPLVEVLAVEPLDVDDALELLAPAVEPLPEVELEVEVLLAVLEVLLVVLAVLAVVPPLAPVAAVALTGQRAGS